MKDPIKIIHKFKNNNRRIQYKVYIFIGSLVPEDILKILDIIKNKDFFNSIYSLSIKNIKLLESYYDVNWYEKLFISYHLKEQYKNILSNPTKKREIINKLGKEWYEKHIDISNLEKVIYSFADYYYDTLLDKYRLTSLKKENLDFKTYRKEGEILNEDINLDFVDDNDLVGESNLIGGSKEDDEEEVIDEVVLEDMVEDSFNLEDLSKLYDITKKDDKNIKDTTKMIAEIINDKKWEKKTEVKLEYDNTLDTINYDSKLEDIYEKIYITDEYLYKDDTINTIRQKITVSIPLSNIFVSGLKLLPETIYFWSEYYTKGGKEEIMIGQKWIRKNELLKIDIKPNENLKIYEKLKNNLGYLKESFNYKIKREDDETNILDYYNDYMTTNEIFMLDIYNELGVEYNIDENSKKNLFDVYINIYFPMLSYDKFDKIINLLNNKILSDDIDNIEKQYNSIRNDIKLENEICNIVEETKLDEDKYQNLFFENYIIQTNVHLNINNPKNITGTTIDNKYNLYRIFDNFIVNDIYPFIQYQTPDGQVIYKYYTNTSKLSNTDMLTKWFENTPYGISFKLLLDNQKYIAINLNENGRIEYKITWKEEDKATIENIKETYEYIRNLLKKINSENKKIKIILPDDDKFKYAFINTIQKFRLPGPKGLNDVKDSFKINHNDLSDFARLFFPYIALVIEPKKRISKKAEKVISDVSKFGTYLRYKRISKYDNRIKIHLRILYFLRNFQINDKELINEIAKQFNITDDVAFNEIEHVKTHYGKVISRSKKDLQKIKTLPRAKPPGIGIDIQGRETDKYKIRITGARNKKQLDDIISFLKVLLYLYVETYIYKKPKYQKLKDMLKKLNKIASRRNKVVEIVNYESEIKNIKIITALDKKRLGFRPEKGENQWTRSCQNSGNDKKRRPEIINESNIEQLIKAGYKLNDKTGFYERSVEITVKKKKQKVILRAIKLQGENGYNYYTCDPINNEHIYIGFLSRGNNPNDLCMPCCFKKDQLVGDNKTKKKYYLECIGEKIQNKESNEKQQNIITDKIYILQETNKVQDNRYLFLSKYLDIFFNKAWNHDNKIKNHYLYESKSGYYLKYTVKHEKYNFLATIANIFDKDVEDIKNIIIDFINSDKDDIYFTFLNGGNIKNIFKTRDNFIDYIKSSLNLEHDILGDLLLIPGLFTKNGIFTFLLEKHNIIKKKSLEKEEVLERYYINCLNYENNYMINENRDYIILLKENKNYFPIYKIQKDEKITKKISITKLYQNNYIIEELKNYYNKSCDKSLFNKVLGNSALNAKYIIQLLKDKGNNIKLQYVDNRNKCKYLLLDNNLLLPVYPSGISYDYKINHISKINRLLNYFETIKYLSEIDKKIKLGYIPKIVFYDKIKEDNIRILSIYLENELIIPIKIETVNIKHIKKLGLIVKFQPLEDSIDNALIEEPTPDTIDSRHLKLDDRHLRIKEHLYKNESYNIFRLELSLYLENNHDIKDKIINIVDNDNIKLIDKKYELRKILFNIINKKLINQNPNNKNMVELVDQIKNINEYSISNIRDYCQIHKTQDKCNNNLHCTWKNNTCKMILTKNMAFDFINKIIEEMIQNSIQFKEIIQDENYYVSDIVDQSQYTNRENQIIVKTTNYNINKIIADILGSKDYIHNIKSKQIIDEVYENYPELLQLGNQYSQEIVSNKDTVIRAFVNCYYWINNPLYDIESRNLGYYSNIQTQMTNLFKAKIIDYIQNNIKNIDNNILLKFRKNSYNTDTKIELLVLSLLLDYRIVVYDNYNNIIQLYLQGYVDVNDENIQNFTKEEFRSSTIFIKLDFERSKSIPKTIYSIYYK